MGTRAAKRDAAIHHGLIAWYRRHARDLPWRRTRDPYAIWLSEVMLQQTRVETVIPYYQRWLEAFPTVEALANASEDAVLKLWEGLGYYRRARNFHRAARVVATERAGRLPETAEQWQTLPGVGRYTASAVASIAFDEAVPVVDGNVKRVLARLDRIDAPIDDRETVALMWRRAASILLAGSASEPGTPGAFNQAMMELGARVCVPRRPSCLLCPVRASCDARSAGVQEALPVKGAKRVVPRADWVSAWITRGGRILAGQRPPGLLGGLWELPTTTVQPGETDGDALTRMVGEDLTAEVADRGKADRGKEEKAAAGQTIATIEHVFTHLRVTIRVAPVALAGKPVARRHVALKWVRRAELDALALPVAMRKLVRVILADR